MKPRRNQDRGSFDSLLDTMTNVVGILIIAVAVTQVSVGEAVRRTRQPVVNLPEVSEEQLTKAKEQAAELRELLAKLREKWGKLRAQAADEPADKERIDPLIAKLRKELDADADIKAKMADIRKALRELTQREKEVDRRLQAVQKERDRLQALVDTMPPPPPPIFVRLPNPRKAEAGMTLIGIACRHGKLYPLSERLGVRLEAEFRKVMRKPTGRAVPGKSDYPRIEAWFRSRDIGDDHFRIRITAHPSDLLLEYVPRRTAGWSAEVLDRKGSPFAVWLDGIDARRQYVFFAVWPDSFRAYLKAREKLGNRKIGGRLSKVPAGWRPFDNSDGLRISLVNPVQVDPASITLD